ncbi:MAG: hypothetical protein IH830_00815 [Planctomycetes bacterium]|nr:hypothetical protein [Planctomycetota bacterium]
MARKKATNKTTRAPSRRKTTKTAVKKKARTNKQAPRSATKRPTKKKSAKRATVKKASAARSRKKSSVPSGSDSRSKKKTAARKKAPGAKVKTATRKKPKTKATPTRTASRRRSNVSTQDRSPEPPPITDYTDRSDVSSPSEVIEESASIAPAAVTASVALAESPVEPMAESVRPTDTEALPQPHDSLGQTQEIEVESQDRAVEPIENARPDESFERPASPQTVETEVESPGSNAPANHPSSEPLSLDEVASHLDELLNVSTVAEPQKPDATAEPQESSPATPGIVETSSTDELSNDEVSEHEPQVGEISEPTDASIQHAATEETASVALAESPAEPAADSATPGIVETSADESSNDKVSEREPQVGEISEPTDASIQQAATEETASDADAGGGADSIGPGAQPRDVDQASAEQPPTPAEPTAEQPAEEGSAMEGLDDALASEVESLMEEDFESVEQRLGNDSQEREEAAGSESPTASDPSGPSAEAGTAISTPDEQRPAEPGSEEGVADPSSSTGKDVETDELNSSAAALAEGASPSPQAEESTPPKDEAATEADPQSPPESDSQPDAKSEAETAGSDSSATTASESGQLADGEKEKSQPQPVGAAKNLPAHAVWSAAEPHVVSVLRWMNSPLRHVPPSARPAVDWIALSLVFWVPIVWLIALFAVGR